MKIVEKKYEPNGQWAGVFGDGMTFQVRQESSYSTIGLAVDGDIVLKARVCFDEMTNEWKAVSFSKAVSRTDLWKIKTVIAETIGTFTDRFDLV